MSKHMIILNIFLSIRFEQKGTEPTFTYYTVVYPHIF